MLMFVVGFVAVIIMYYVFHYFSGKLLTWASGTRGPHVVVDRRRLDDVLYFAVIGIVVSLIQFIIWAVQLAAWAVNALG
jgi:hypothetical protein